MTDEFERDIEGIEKRATKWWPSFLSDLETSGSIIPTLLKTQDKFISILNLADENPFALFEVIKASDFPANLFLKHLVVLADFGGEQIQRLNSNFKSVFPKKKDKYFFQFRWNDKNFEYVFKSLPVSGVLNNSKLGIDGPSIQKSLALDSLKEDMMAILLFGSASINTAESAILTKCEIGTLLGKKDELEKYIKEKYIWVSRITGGAQANTLGQVAQTYVVDFLKKSLGSSYKITRNGTISADDGKIPFDIVVRKGAGAKAVGIEITFQVTTNSTIERKAGQAPGRIAALHKNGNYIAYIIDGAGNFQRRSAISVICRHSDCTIAYTIEEFKVLGNFIKKVLK